MCQPRTSFHGYGLGSLAFEQMNMPCTHRDIDQIFIAFRPYLVVFWSKHFGALRRAAGDEAKYQYCASQEPHHEFMNALK
jgi:hypothetical protein